MKATGIVRRIDDLGRVVIPKEIRRTLRIREGDPLEIFVDRDGEVILKKYSPINELGNFAKEYAESLAEHSAKLALISDRDSIIAVAGGSKKEYMNKNISIVLEKTMENRQTYASRTEDEGSELMEGAPAVSSFVAAPIIANGDPIGTVVLAQKDGEPVNEVDHKLAETAAGFLAKQMEQ
ncbi:MAG TPA: stage V sporulation protein T [Bacillales bacterium]|nr:stage V sporulation protein T [Bacillales bacterium]